jgi:hypothetical protein
MAKPPKVEQDYTDEEVAKRRDAGLKRLLKTPPKPHAEVAGKSVPAKPKSGNRKTRK